jgi:hypothetical protein
MRKSKRRTTAAVNVTVEGGSVQGIVGAGSVVVENLIFYGSTLPVHPPQEIDEGTIPPCPYPGLAYFTPQNSALFFGRETAIARLQTSVQNRALTALVGASGSGKSSVVLAGLAPRLHAEGGWRFSHFRVGTEANKNPFLSLARCLVPLLGAASAAQQLKDIQELAAALESGDVGLTNVLGACRNANLGKRILLIADQFEELFTLVTDQTIRLRFVDALLKSFPDTADGSSPGISLLLTLRADFYGIGLRNRTIADALQGRVENLGPMTREELREAILRPAGVVHFENGLIDTLLDDVENKPGSLPLLQFALREMWSRLDRRRMTRIAYDAIGGVEGALAKRAQAVYEALTTNGADKRAELLFRRLFTRLVSLGQGAEDTRRIVGREELDRKTWALAQRLAGEDNRLVVTSAPAPDHDTVELVHEALIRNWPTLIDWLNRDRAFQSWLRQLKPRVDEWQAHPDDSGTLLRGGPLAVAEEWLARRSDEMNRQEMAYIEASKAFRESERLRDQRAIEREQQRLAEMATAQDERTRALAESEAALRQAAEAQRRRARLRNVLFIVMAGALATLSWSWLSVSESSRRLAEQVRIAEGAASRARLANQRAQEKEYEAITNECTTSEEELKADPAAPEKLHNFLSCGIRYAFALIRMSKSKDAKAFLARTRQVTLASESTQGDPISAFYTLLMSQTMAVAECGTTATKTTARSECIQSLASTVDALADSVPPSTQEGRWREELLRGTLYLFNYLHDEGEYESAFEHTLRSVERLSVTQPKDVASARDVARALNLLSWSALMTKRFSYALDVSERALKLTDEFGVKDLDSTKLNYAHSLLFNGRTEAARRVYQQLYPSDIADDIKDLMSAGLCAKLFVELIGQSGRCDKPV